MVHILVYQKVINAWYLPKHLQNLLLEYKACWVKEPFTEIFVRVSDIGIMKRS